MKVTNHFKPPVSDPSFDPGKLADKPNKSIEFGKFDGFDPGKLDDHKGVETSFNGGGGVQEGLGGDGV